MACNNNVLSILLLLILIFGDTILFQILGGGTSKDATSVLKKEDANSESACAKQLLLLGLAAYGDYNEKMQQQKVWMTRYRDADESMGELRAIHEEYMRAYRRVYKNAEEKEARFEIFKKIFVKAYAYNNDHASFSEVIHFAHDRTIDEVPACSTWIKDIRSRFNYSRELDDV